MKKRYLVVDYDPDVIETLEHEHIHHLYGDATDIELLDEIGLEKAELVVSTLGDFSANRIILKHTLQRNPEAIFICHAGDYDRAAQLYEHGASYVILPHFIGSQQMSQFIRRLM
jgi:voltage-gated potassium channel Kch